MIQKLLVALDGSARTAGVFAAALEIAKQFGATLVPFRAIQVPPEFPPAAHVGQVDDLPGHMAEEALQEILPLLENVDAKWVTPVIRYGQPWRAILEVAEEHDVDLIVVGSHGYHGVDFLLGTTAGKVANRAQRNVLVVHERPSSG